MKVAFHFHQDIGKNGVNYAYSALQYLFSQNIAGETSIRSVVYCGDLLIRMHSCDSQETATGSAHSFNIQRYRDIFTRWFSHAQRGWFRFKVDEFERAFSSDIFAICLDTVDEFNAEKLHEKLAPLEDYFGAFEVDDTSGVHWVLYSGSLSCRYRLDHKKLYLFWDGYNEDSKDEGELKHWIDLGFDDVLFESSEWKKTIFDKYDNFGHAKKVAKWRKHASQLLASSVDSIIYQLEHAAPEIGDKLWAAIDAFNTAQGAEEYAHVAISCRRIIEYVADEVFPPVEGGGEGKYKLGKKQYRNRLLAFADKERKSKTSVDLIQVSTQMLNEQLEKLQNLQNKGIHDDITIRSEARRVIIRTLLILDDIISLKDSPLKTKIKFDEDLLYKILNHK